MFMKEALGKMKNSKEKNMCWQDGRLFEDKEDWIVDSCTKCTCQVVARKMCKFSINVDDRANLFSWQESKIVCHQITCPPVACASPSFLDGECCPVCLREDFDCFCHHTDANIYSLKKSLIRTCVFTVTSCGQWWRLVPLVRVDRMHCHLWYRNTAKGALVRRNK